MSERQERDEAIPLAKKALLADLDAAREALREADAQAERAYWNALDAAGVALRKALDRAEEAYQVAIARAWEAHHRREADLEAITRAEEVSRE